MAHKIPICEIPLAPAAVRPERRGDTQRRSGGTRSAVFFSVLLGKTLTPPAGWTQPWCWAVPCWRNSYIRESNGNDLPASPAQSAKPPTESEVLLLFAVYLADGCQELRFAGALHGGKGDQQCLLRQGQCLRIRVRFGSISLFFSLSSLLATTMTGQPVPLNQSHMVTSSAVGLCRASTISTPRVMSPSSAK